MKKEILVAILIGLFFGLIVTYGIYRASQANTENQVADVLETNNQEQENNSNNAISNINIDTPEDESIVSDLRQTIAGTTLSNSFVIIYVNETPYITTADQAGAFSISADLSLGSNVIGVHTLNENGQETSTELTVGYITQPLETQLATESATINTNDEASQASRSAEPTSTSNN
jgi:hypothetical protein